MPQGHQRPKTGTTGCNTCRDQNCAGRTACLLPAALCSLQLFGAIGLRAVEGGLPCGARTDASLLPPPLGSLLLRRPLAARLPKPRFPPSAQSQFRHMHSKDTCTVIITQKVNMKRLNRCSAYVRYKVGPLNPALSFKRCECKICNRPPSALNYCRPGCVKGRLHAHQRVALDAMFGSHCRVSQRCWRTSSSACRAASRALCAS